jgi:GT2 family glycosyltransferase
MRERHAKDRRYGGVGSVKTSIIIPVRNQPNCLHWTLSSLTKQAAGTADFEVIVVDDGSTDDTPSVAESFQDLLRLEVLRNGTNHGRSFSRNRGASRAAGEQLLFLDADSCARPDLVAGHQRWHVDSPDSVIIGRRVEMSWWSMDKLGQGLPVLPLPFEGDQRDGFGLSDPDRTGYVRTPWLFTASHNLSVPADVYRAVGGFDENFVRWGYEDNEFGYRVFRYFGRRPGHFKHDPDLVCYHMPHFRDWAAEWGGAKSAQDYIKSKHRHFDVELLVYPPNPARIAQTLPYYEQCIEHLTGASGPDTLKRFTTLIPHDGGDQLWVGTGLRAVLGSDPAVHVFDHALPEAADNHHLLGMYLPFDDHTLSAVVNVDLWRILDPVDLSACVMEGLRAAGTLYLAMSKGLTGDPARRLGLVGDSSYLVTMLAARLAVDILHEDESVVLIRCR